MNDFARDLERAVQGLDRPREFQPCVHYNREGDCLEFLVSSNRYWADRIDPIITVYMDFESDKIVGVMIKGVRNLVKVISEKIPGFELAVDDGKVQMESLLLAAFWVKRFPEEKIPSLRKIYRRLIHIAEEAKAETDFCLA